MGETATTWRCSPTRFMFSTTTTLLSQRGEPSPLLFGTFPKRCMGRRDNTDFPRPMRKSGARRRPACPLLARRARAPHERGAGGGSDPPFLTTGAASGRVSRFTSQFTVNPPLGGVAPSTVIPAGRLKC